MIRPSVLITALLTALPVSARDHAPGAGAAIVPVFTAQHSAMRPGEEVTLVACVANGNPHVRHGIRQGDEFRMTFVEGTPVSCASVSVSPPGIDIVSADFECTVEAGALLIRHVGADAPWPVGASICATIAFVAPPQSTAIVPNVEPVQVGAYAPPVPPLVQLAIDSEIGSVGPEGPPGPRGPVGPEGPQGVPGPSTSGAIHHWLSSGWTGPLGPTDDVVPGLDQVFTVAPGSSLYLHLTAVLHEGCRDSAFRDWRSTAVIIELDGVEVSRRWGRGDGTSVFDVIPPVSDQFVARDLSAGTHRVRVRAPADPLPGEPPGGAPLCVGHATDPRLLARLTAIELRP